MTAMRFMPVTTSFSSPDRVPENQCYCLTEPCLPSGLLDISGCQPDSPIYLSWPHFLHGDRKLRKTVNGLSPSEVDHSFIMDVLPVRMRTVLEWRISRYKIKDGETLQILRLRSVPF